MGKINFKLNTSLKKSSKTEKAKKNDLEELHELVDVVMSHKKTGAVVVLSEHEKDGQEGYAVSGGNCGMNPSELVAYIAASLNGFNTVDMLVAYSKLQAQGGKQELE